MRLLVLLLIVGGGAAGGYYWYNHLTEEPPPTFRTAAVKRGDLVAAISATGTVEPEEVIDVGAQVAGKISTLGGDPKETGKTIDYGSLVEAGTVLAQIDDAIYRAHVGQAKANVQRAQADLLQFKAKQRQTEREWKRLENLVITKAVSISDYDLAKANYEVAQAMVGVGEATIAQNQAALDLANTNLGYTTIKSPVKGVIIDRRINVGQTVVASLNAPSLFLIAKDLRRMQVWASVNEADIGRIHRGQQVQFTVDAFPAEPFHGEVAQIRLNATMTQNVVTYTVVVSTDNSNGKLLPYLTANLQFEIDRRKGVLLVPTAALRFEPPPDQAVPEARSLLQTVGGKAAERGRGGPPASKPASKVTKPAENRGRLWVTEGALLRPIEVRVGVSDGANTEVSAEGLREGLEVVLGEVRGQRGRAATNPFAPKLFGGQKSQSAP